MLTLYYELNTVSLAPRIALEEARAEYRAIHIAFSRNEQRTPEYLELNPKGRVPALVTKRGVLTEVPALLAYIAQLYPAANLAPLDDPFGFAEVQAFNSYLCSTVHIAHVPRIRGYRWTDDAAALEAIKRKVPQNVAEAFSVIERHFLQGPWVLGDRYSICDIYLFTLAQWLEDDGVDTALLPQVIAHRERMRRRVAVRTALVAEHNTTG